MVDVAPPPVSLSQDALDRLFASSDDEDGGPSILPDMDRAQIARDAQRKARQSLNMPEPAPAAPSTAAQGTPDGPAGANAKRRRDEEEDEEPKRRVIAKIDAERLLGEYGFPALIQQTKNFKPKGKGREKEDLDRIMTLYQLWAHRMFPKRRFIDTVERVEKVCRERRMLVALSVWRDELNPIPKQNRDPISEADMVLSDNEGGDQIKSKPVTAGQTNDESDERHSLSNRRNNDDDSDDEEIWAEILDRMKANNAAKSAAADAANGATQPSNELERLFDKDENAVLDDMLREEETLSAKKTEPIRRQTEQEEDEDALWDEMVREQEREELATAQPTTAAEAVHVDDEEDILELMREAEDSEAKDVASAAALPLGSGPTPIDVALTGIPPPGNAVEEDWERLYD
ncbi:Swi3-domain-containing protein [Dacryopinax primogenitus]|uniref:Chromosome segregation in meiosis protein n=1 Tax=Dacryopinax primogenitus (strain DJM 731) TaxID=1858805 RepID=M5G5R5_DACPD|nr:Swi3-domain-containing protein [Dacryopinax primogenitus]EJU05601.1 Swi3-domain-containing protein [Dacryopinax primogenitus]